MEHKKNHTQTGTIVALFGAQGEIESETGSRYHCHLRKNAAPLAVGDRVIWQLEAHNSATIVEPLPRTSILTRIERNRRTKLIAANVDTIIIVTTPPPLLSEYLIDRYITAALHAGIQPVILLNKADLLTPTQQDAVAHRLKSYQQIGLPVMIASTHDLPSMTALTTLLQNKTGILVGTSGVGKSSIIRLLTTDTSIKVGAVAEGTGLGKHTTTATRLYRLQKGGSLIDSPGVREFSLGHIEQKAVITGFPELIPLTQHCQFRNCEHQQEPGCALQQAAQTEQISPVRLANYHRIITELDSKQKNRR